MLCLHPFANELSSFVHWPFSVETPVLIRLSLLECEHLCDKDTQCKGVYVDDLDCFVLYQLLVDAHTVRTGQSYTKADTEAPGVVPPIMRLELSLPVTTN